MGRIVLITYEEVNPKTKQKTGRLLVSHGIDEDTLEGVLLPNEPLSNFPAKFIKGLNEWVMEGER